MLGKHYLTKEVGGHIDYFGNGDTERFDQMQNTNDNEELRTAPTVNKIKFFCPTFYGVY